MIETIIIKYVLGILEAKLQVTKWYRRDEIFSPVTLRVTEVLGDLKIKILGV